MSTRLKRPSSSKITKLNILDVEVSKTKTFHELEHGDTVIRDGYLCMVVNLCSSCDDIILSPTSKALVNLQTGNVYVPNSNDKTPHQIISATVKVSDCD